MMPIPLRARIAVWNVSMLAIALVVFSAAIYACVYQSVTKSLEWELHGTLQNLGALYTASWDAKGAKWARGEIQESFRDGHDRFVRVYKGGQLLYQSADLTEPPIKIASVPLQSPPRQGIQYVTVGGKHRLMVFTQVAKTTRGVPIVLQCGAAVSMKEQVLRTLLLVLLITTPLILLLTAVGSWLLVKQPLEPLLVLAEQAERIGREGLGQRLAVVPSGDELERLSTTFNAMIGRLESAVAHNRRFSADASHELRTPLSIIRGELEQIFGLPDLTPLAAEGAGSALEEVERMSRIVNTLMTIARLDCGGELIERCPVDLEELVATVVEQMQPLADQEFVKLSCKTTGPVIVVGDRSRLTQVLVNLLDNAMKNTPEGGRVKASVLACGEAGVLEVEDNGMGIPEDAVPFVLDRFYRADKARSRESGGVGLGLSIVKAICVAHNGRVTVTSVEGKGTTCRVELPCLGGQDTAMTFASLRR